MANYKQLGHIRSMRMKLTSPTKMDHDMEMQALVLLCGMNGVGKTIILKFNWILGSIAHAIIAADAKGGLLTTLAQFYLDYSLEDHMMDGTIGCSFESGVEIDIVCKEGEVTSVNVLREPDVMSASHPIYMSTETRLFTETVRYLRFCKSHDIAFKVIESEENLMKVLGLYKIYDVMFMERLLGKLNGGLSVEKAAELETNMKKFDENFTLKGMKVTERGDDIVLTTDGENWSSVKLLGNGHQALLTMQLGIL